MRILVTGGCGFIGSNFVRFLLGHYQHLLVTNVDALTYAGNLENVAGLESEYSGQYAFYRADIANTEAIRRILSEHRYYAVINFAAESHVDRSILSPKDCVHTNILGVANLLELSREAGVRRFVQISTDEVYGDNVDGISWKENALLQPSSPYSASKASADMLVLAAARTYGQEVIITRGSNNYGPRQHPEKLIPRAITLALRDQPVPIFGDGEQERDWIHVDDHCLALQAVLLDGKPGTVYHIASGKVWKNIEVVRAILSCLGKSESLIHHVPDRPGHDRSYRLDTSKLESELGWKPTRDFTRGLEETVDWYLRNRAWWESQALSPAPRNRE